MRTLAEFPSEAALNDAGAGLTDLYSAYFGEVLIRAVDGGWRLSPGERDDNDDNVFIGWPYVVRFLSGGDESPLSPLMIFRILIEDRQAGRLQRSFEKFTRDLAPHSD
jgi:hypothetical protein